MIQFYLRMSLMTVILCALLLTGGMLWGSSLTTQVLMAVSTSTHDDQVLPKWVLFDLQRELRVTHTPALNGIIFGYWQVTKHKIFLRVKADDLHIWYVYDLMNAKLTQILESFNASTVKPSPDGQRLALVQSDLQGVLVINTDTLLTSAIEPIRADGTPKIYWSHNSQKFMVIANTTQRQDPKLYLIDRDGKRVHAFEPPANSPELDGAIWSSDDRYIRFWRLNGDERTNAPLMVLDAQTGTPHPLVIGLQEADGYAGSGWTCADQWLPYVAYEADVRVGYLFNLQTSENIRLNDLPMLQTQSIGNVVLTHSCRYAFIFGEPAYSPEPSGYDPAFTYLYDTQKKAVVISVTSDGIGQSRVPPQFTDNQVMYYYTRAQNPQLLQFTSQSMLNLQAPPQAILLASQFRSYVWRSFNDEQILYTDFDQWTNEIAPYLLTKMGDSKAFTRPGEILKLTTLIEAW
ncbi:MAG: hypothetical protein H7Y11_15680 [Armatimonadetes bacterium]|nr:hypothetical protein [Anaerolineae bacterium]